MMGNTFYTHARSRSQRAQDGTHRPGESLKAWAGEGSEYDETSFFRKLAVSVGSVGIWEALGETKSKAVIVVKAQKVGPQPQVMAAGN